MVRGDSFVRRGLLEAQAHNKPIIPLIAPGVHPKNVPIIIKHLTFLNFSDLEADLPKLIDRLRQEPENFVQPAPTHDPFYLYVRRLRDLVTSELETSVVDPENLLTLSICAFEPALPTGFKSRVLHHNPMISLPKHAGD